MPTPNKKVGKRVKKLRSLSKRIDLLVDTMFLSNHIFTLPKKQAKK